MTIDHAVQLFEDGKFLEISKLSAFTIYLFHDIFQLFQTKKGVTKV